ncbi:MAG: 16S rRNA (guanine(527)-N(7))-methyltransferase RsmG [Bacteroidia bacterium]
MENSISLLKKYFPTLTEKQEQQFILLKSLYEEWNAKINVISRKDIDFLYERHVLHSLGIAKILTFRAGTKILDVGTGGGFPGIPLAILFPETNFYLVDSIGKKITVVKAIVEALELKNVRAEKMRAEEINEKFDFVVSRAVTEFPVFYNWVRTKFIKLQKNSLPNGILYLKGGDIKEEFSAFKKSAIFYELKNNFSEEFFETKKVAYLPCS